MNAPSLPRRDFLRALGLGSATLAQAPLLFADERAALPGGPADESAAPIGWPVLQRFDRQHQLRLALPLGGIGTGTVSLGGRGDLRDWEIMNRPAKGFVPSAEAAPFFALYVKAPDGARFVRALEGPLDPTEYEGSHGSTAPNHGLPRFQDALFAVAYPLAQVRLQDPDCPVEARLEALNPLVPADPEASGLPVAVLRYALHNRGDQPLTAAVCGSLPNFIGNDGSVTRRDWKGDSHPVGEKGNRNHHRVSPLLEGIFMDSSGVDPKSPAWGTLALATLPGNPIGFRTNWEQHGWGGSLLDFWDDFAEDGLLTQRSGSVDAPMASLSALVTLPPHTTTKVTFLLTWHFPNRRTWTPGNPETDEDIIGNYYTTRFPDAWAVAEAVATRLEEHERRTVAFVRSFVQSDLPAEVKEAALNNLSSLRSQTCFRTPDGHFYGFEGCCNHQGCCHGSCTHVWNYEQATAFLFGTLARSMREVEFAHATDDQGLMSFRVHLPLTRSRHFGKAAADGQMGCLLKLYRDWQLSGDTTWLGRLWPKARRALEFCWITGGWDADRDGVMEGCQHNTMDVEYYGPNPQMQFWYLGALRAAGRMARAQGEAGFADQCDALYRQGRNWTEANLFNGEYYEHRIQLPRNAAEVAPSLLIGMGAKDPTRPDFQLGPGCLVDQLVGQFMASVCGLGPLADPPQLQATLDSIWRYNRRVGLTAHFNNMRSFALGDENALLMASFPKGRPTFPFPYFAEVMTGFEYVAAVEMIYQGRRDRGLECIRDIRARYDGRKRNPFNEAECGHHYARAMASWAAVLACSGFHYSAVSAELSLQPQAGHVFWSTGYAWGTLDLQGQPEAFRVQLQVIEGSLRLQRFLLPGFGSHAWPNPQALGPGETRTWSVPRDAPRPSL